MQQHEQGIVRCPGLACAARLQAPRVALREHEFGKPLHYNEGKDPAKGSHAAPMSWKAAVKPGPSEVMSCKPSIPASMVALSTNNTVAADMLP